MEAKYEAMQNAFEAYWAGAISEEKLAEWLDAIKHFTAEETPSKNETLTYQVKLDFPTAQRVYSFEDYREVFQAINEAVNIYQPISIEASCFHADPANPKQFIPTFFKLKY